VKKQISTPYGRVRAEVLEQLRATLDTRQLLAAVDQTDQFCAQWRDELRSDLLALHGLAHTTVNGAPLAPAPGDETLAEMAASLRLVFGDAARELRDLANLLGRIAELAPE
jgi:hypothetical protein